MYDIAKVETNPAIRALLWNPERIVPALYDLRNMGILGKVSQIDAFRQFTTKGGLAETVQALVSRRGRQRMKDTEIVEALRSRAGRSDGAPPLWCDRNLCRTGALCGEVGPGTATQRRAIPEAPLRQPWHPGRHPG